MGHVPLPLPLRMTSESVLRDRMRGRFSRFRSRRASALAACRELVRRAEVECGYREDDTAPRPPAKPKRSSAPTYGRG